MATMRVNIISEHHSFFEEWERQFGKAGDTARPSFGAAWRRSPSAS